MIMLIVKGPTKWSLAMSGFDKRTDTEEPEVFGLPRRSNSLSSSSRQTLKSVLKRPVIVNKLEIFISHEGVIQARDMNKFAAS